MNILVLNSGSSSLKARVFDADLNEIFHFHLEQIATKNCQFEAGNEKEIIRKKIKIKNFKQAVSLLKELLGEIKIKAIGQRIVHGGEHYQAASIIDKRLKQEIKKLFPLAELHNPINLDCINATEAIFKKIKQVAIFDTAFHQSIKKEKFIYALPYEYYENRQIRKYGFHGTSHKYVYNELSKILKKKNLKVVSCHLGNGSSITAIKNGISIDTTMGMTPLAGIPMGTRSGDLDPGVVLDLCANLKVKQVSELLNKKSGLLGISGISNHMLEIYNAAKKGNENAKLTIEHLAYKIAAQIAAYTVPLQGIDAIIFTGGMGEHAFYLRSKVAKHLSHLGIKIDQKENRKNSFFIESKESKIKIAVIKTNEELQIAIETKKLLKI